MKIKFIAIIAILASLLILMSASFAAGNQTAISASNGDVLQNDYYFDANVKNDTGNGTITNPYKDLTPSRINTNSVIHLASGEYNFNNSKTLNNVTIVGENPTDTIVKNAKFTVSSSLTLINVTFVSSSITNNGNLNALNTIFKDSVSSLYGGAINSNAKSNINLDNCTFINNSAKFGGAIYIKDGFLNISNSRFLNNSASLFGGAITTINSKVNLDKSTFKKNNANYYGGVIYLLYGSFNLTNSRFDNNSAKEGGALFVDDIGPCFILNNEFTSNNAATVGAVYALACNITNSLISDNTYFNNSGNMADAFETDFPNMTISNGDYILINYNSPYNGTLPSSYDMRLLNLTTPVKNQGGGGNCWAFASLAALESCLLKATGNVYDFSEENMKNLMSLYSDYGWDMEPNKGGYDRMAVGYLVSWLGPLNESEDPYSGSTFLSPVLNSTFHVQNIVFLVRNNYTDNDAIKKAILEYGAVATCICWYGSYVNDVKNYYYTGSDGVNHAVAIVGWDDNYSRNNFKTAPPGDGAWIIKNSWGTGSGDNGYYYVSYYDTRCARPGARDVSYTFILNDTIKYDKSYQYDIPGRTDYFLNSSSTVWYKNVFNSSDDEYLAAVSTHFETLTNYTIYIYVNNILKHTQSGFSNHGYYTINLNSFVPLKKGDVFEVVFKISVDGEAQFPISEEISLNKYLYSANTSFLSYDGENWTDMFNLSWAYSTHIYYSQVACIKAFTVYNLISTTLNLSSDITGGYNVKAHVLNQYNLPVTGGNVTFNVSGKYYNVSVVNGWAILELFDSVGEYNVSAVYSNTGYISSRDSISFNVTLLNTTLVLKINPQNPINVSAYVINELGWGVRCGNVTFNVNGTYYTVNVSDGVACLKGIFKTLELYNISAVFNPIYYFLSSNNKTSYEVSKISTNITLSFSGIHNPVNITACVLNQYGYPVVDGNVTFTVDGVDYTVNVTEGYATLTHIFKTFNTHNVTAVFNPIYYYESSQVYKEFNVSLINTYLVLVYTDRYNPVNVTVHVFDQYGKAVSGGNVSVNIDGEVFNLNLTKGSCNFTWEFKQFGLHNISVTYNGLEYYYNASNISDSRYLPLMDTNITLTILDSHNPVNITAFVCDKDGNPVNAGNVTFVIEARSYTVDVINGYATLTHVFKTFDECHVSAIFNSVYYYTSSRTQKDFNVTLMNTTMSVTFNNYNPVIINVTVFDEYLNPVNMGDVTFYIEGNRYTADVVDGLCQLKHNFTNLGIHEIQAFYNGVRYYYVSSEINFNITVNSTIISQDATKTFNSQYSFILLDNYGNPLKNTLVNVSIASKIYTINSDENGVVKLDITLNPSTYLINITNPINGEVKNQTINVVKRISENNDVVMYYGAGKYYKVKVLDDDGNVACGVKVTFTINNNKYTKTSDSKGYASFKITQKPGKYTIKVTYKGYTVSNKITVKSTIITKNIKVKKGKTIKFKAKLLNKNGKALKNKKITFKFKGKTYKVKTNKKGIAYLKITKKYKRGKYIITTSYAKLKIKNTIRIK